MDKAEFADLLDRAKRFDDQAVRQLLAAFEPEIRIMVRVQLPLKLRQKFDSIDFTQAVWASFFLRIREKDTPFESPRHLGAFLAGIAKNKVMEEHRKRTRTRKYDIRREEQLYVKRGGRDTPVEVVSSDPSPSEEAQAGDRLRQLLKCEGPEMAKIVEMRREGLSYEEIGPRVGLHERTVRRMVNGMRSRMEA